PAHPSSVKSNSNYRWYIANSEFALTLVPKNQHQTVLARRRRWYRGTKHVKYLSEDYSGITGNTYSSLSVFGLTFACTFQGNIFDEKGVGRLGNWIVKDVKTGLGDHLVKRLPEDKETQAALPAEKQLEEKDIWFNFISRRKSASFQWSLARKLYN
ncbi:hypothetical protein BT96DRAFT_952223, partial [Gymnopus androsaceus JB14]